MQFHLFPFLAVASAVAVPVFPISMGGEDPLPDPDPEITAAELRHHVGFLASDELRGREAGTPDAVRAAHYLARALERAGVDPAGDDGTYLQAVPLVQHVHEGLPSMVVTTREGERIDAAFGVDFTVFTRGEPRATGALPILVVRTKDEMPAKADPEVALFIDASSRERGAWLSANGLGDGSGFGLYVRAGSTRAGRPGQRPRGRLMRDSGSDEHRGDSARLNGGLRDLLVAGDLVTIELHYQAHTERITDYNVVGRLPGKGELANEAIVFSAHYDHIGVRGEPAEGVDVISNGADDDASGVAAVLELAEAFAHGAAPARELIFLLAGGEEKGLLGTYHHIDFPAAPLERTVCNLNFEMIGRPDDSVGGAGRLWLTGFERSTLGTAFQEAGLTIRPDQRLDQNFFQRSDNYAFALRGIVAQTLSSYNMHQDYHQVTDEADLLDYAHMEEAVRNGYVAARLLADGDLRPEWLPGGKPEARGR